MDPATIAMLVALGLPAFASALSAVLPSDNWFMRFVDVLAINVGKAKNDPKVQ